MQSIENIFNSRPVLIFPCASIFPCEYKSIPWFQLLFFPGIFDKNIKTGLDAQFQGFGLWLERLLQAAKGGKVVSQQELDKHYLDKVIQG